MWRGGLCHMKVMIYVRMRMDSQCFLFPIQILDFRFSFCHSFWLLPNAESDFGGASRLAWIHGEDLYKRERSGRTRDIREMVRLRPGRPPPYERSARIAMIRSHGAWARASCMPPPCEPWHEPLCPQAQHAMSHVHRNARRVIARHRASSQRARGSHGYSLPYCMFPDSRPCQQHVEEEQDGARQAEIVGHIARLVHAWKRRRRSLVGPSLQHARETRQAGAATKVR